MWRKWREHYRVTPLVGLMKVVEDIFQVHFLYLGCDGRAQLVGCIRDESLLPFSCGFQVLDLVLQVDGHPVERGGQSTELARLFRQASAQIAPGYASDGPSRCCQRTECGAGYKVTKAHTEQGEHGGHSYEYVAQAGECLLALRLGIEEVDVWPGVRGPTSNG